MFQKGFLISAVFTAVFAALPASAGISEFFEDLFSGGRSSTSDGRERSADAGFQADDAPIAAASNSRAKKARSASSKAKVTAATKPTVSRDHHVIEGKIEDVREEAESFLTTFYTKLGFAEDCRYVRGKDYDREIRDKHFKFAEESRLVLERLLKNRKYAQLDFQVAVDGGGQFQEKLHAAQARYEQFKVNRIGALNSGQSFCQYLSEGPKKTSLPLFVQMDRNPSYKVSR